MGYRDKFRVLIKLPKKNLKKSLELAMDILEKDKN